MSQVIETEDSQGQLRNLLVDVHWDVVSASEWGQYRRRMERGTMVFRYTIKDAISRDVCVASAEQAASLTKEADALLAVAVASALREGQHTILEWLVDVDGTQRCWFLALSEDRIVYGTDVVGSGEEVEEKVLEHLQISQNEHEEIHGNARDLIAGQPPGDSVFDLIEPEHWKKAELESALLKLVSQRSPLQLATAAAIPVISVMAAFMLWPSDQGVERQQPSPEQKRADLRQQAEQAMRDTVMHVYQYPLLAQLSEMIDRGLGTMPSRQAEWRLVSTNCKGVECNSVYENTGYAQPHQLRAVVGDRCELTFDPAAQTAECQQSFQGFKGAPGGYDAAVAPAGQRERLRDHLLTLMDVFSETGEVGFSGFSPISFDNKQMIEESRIPQRNNWQMQLPLAGIDALTRDVFAGAAPVAVDQIEIDWNGRALKVSGFIYGETKQ